MICANPRSALIASAGIARTGFSISPTLALGRGNATTRDTSHGCMNSGSEGMVSSEPKGAKRANGRRVRPPALL